jgi:hypothetical protein
MLARLLGRATPRLRPLSPPASPRLSTLGAPLRSRHAPSLTLAAASAAAAFFALRTSPLAAPRLAVPQRGLATMAATQPAPPQAHANFDLVRRVELHYAPGMSVEKWQSRVTGMTVYWANFDSEYCAGASRRRQWARAIARRQ